MQEKGVCFTAACFLLPAGLFLELKPKKSWQVGIANLCLEFVPCEFTLCGYNRPLIILSMPLILRCHPQHEMGSSSWSIKASIALLFFLSQFSVQLLDCKGWGDLSTHTHTPLKEKARCRKAHWEWGGQVFWPNQASFGAQLQGFGGRGHILSYF